MKAKPILTALAVSAALIGALFATGKLSPKMLGLKSAVATPETVVGNAAARDDVAPQPVSVTNAVSADFTQTVLVTGTLVPREEILVAPEIEGLRVVSLKADAGDTVTKGQVLATLVRTQLDAQMAQNTAALAKADAVIAQARSQIKQAEATLAQSAAEFDRAKPLKKQGYLSGSVYDQRQASQRTAVAALASSRDGLLLAQSDRKLIEAQKKELTWRLGNTQVRAPEAGVVSRRTARVGGMASAAADAMFRIIARGEIELDAEVPESQMPKLKEGQIAEVTVPGVGVVSGRLRLISPEIDKATRLGRVRIFLGSDRSLRIGSFSRASIHTATSRGIAVPLSAILFDADGKRVQIVTDGRVKSQRVETGLTSGDLIEVTGGVNEGDLIVTRAGTFLRNGDAVVPVSNAAKSATAESMTTGSVSGGNRVEAK